VANHNRHHEVVYHHSRNALDGCTPTPSLEAIEMKKSPLAKKFKATIDTDKCFGCGLCTIVCEPGAVAMKLDES